VSPAQCGAFLRSLSRTTTCSTPLPQMHRFDHPFDNVKLRTLLRFEKDSDSELVVWSTTLASSLFPKETASKSAATHYPRGRMDVVAGGNKYLYAVEDLGRGSSGRVWLVSAHRGAVCVLKFANTANATAAERALRAECGRWHAAYPHLKEHVEVEKRSGRWALRMPHFSRVPMCDRNADCIAEVANVLRVAFERKGLVHNDVSWKNIGRYKSGVRTTIVVYDMGDVVEGSSGWVDAAVKNLD
jgi:hypothetical protein